MLQKMSLLAAYVTAMSTFDIILSMAEVTNLCCELIGVKGNVAWYSSTSCAWTKYMSHEVRLCLFAAH